MTALDQAKAAIPVEPAHRQEFDQTHIVTIPAGRRWLAVLRLATGFIFLWAFVDKAFGLGFSTPAERAWLNGGAPSQGFLNSDAVVGPLKPFFDAIASPTSDVLFMVAMLAIGAAVMLGIGLRVSAVVGTVLMLAMYLAEWPFGANAASNNPLVDYHIIYALALIVVAVLAAGDTWGFGRQWEDHPRGSALPLARLTRFGRRGSGDRGVRHPRRRNNDRLQNEHHRGGDRRHRGVAGRPGLGSRAGGARQDARRDRHDRRIDLLGRLPDRRVPPFGGTAAA